MKRIFLFLALIFIAPLSSQAQFEGGVLSQESVIEIRPANPEPKTPFTATIDDYALSGQTSSISWRADGKLLSEMANQRSITLTSKASGESTLIEATLGRSGGGSVVLSRVVTPLYLDLIVEAQTRTPGFYLGRSLPSIDSTINVAAILSSPIETKNLIYLWKINDVVIEGGPLRGRSTISFRVPSGQISLLSVEISKTNSELLVAKTTSIRAFEPKLLFYEKSALYGISTKPINTLNLIGASATIVAEPFNLAIKTYNNPALLEWKVDNQKTNNSIGNPYEITLARPAGVASGASDIELHVRNLEDLLQGAKGFFKIKF